MFKYFNSDQIEMQEKDGMSSVFKTQQLEFEARKLRMIRVYCIGLEFFNLMFNIRIPFQIDDAPWYDILQKVSYILIWFYVFFGLVMSYKKSIEWIYSVLVLISLRNAFPLLDIEHESKGKLGLPMIINISLLVTTLNSISFITSLRIRYKMAINIMLVLISFTGLLMQLYSWEEFIDSQNLMMLSIYIPSICAFLCIIYNY